MTGTRKGLTWREFGIGMALAVPFAGLALFSAREVAGYGSFWFMSRQVIRMYCWGIVFTGLALSSISLPRIIADLPDSNRLRAWAIFLVGVGYAMTGGILRWYLLAKRDYQQPSVEPFSSLRLLFVAWVVLIVASVYAMRLENRAKRGTDS